MRTMSTMKKLYSVREITEMLNAELGASGAEYRYTEERVRSRLRYLRSKATDEAKALHVTPKMMGYDRRAKYYTEEDVDKLRAIWIGPMLAEFEVHPLDLDTVDQEWGEEVDVREARADDAAAIFELVKGENVEERDVRGHIATMLKSRKRGTFVAVTSGGDVIGWAHAEVSPPASLLRGRTTGVVHIRVASEKKDSPIAARSLIYRSQWWLTSQGAHEVIVEMPDTTASLQQLIESVSLQPDSDFVHFRSHS